MKRCDTRTKQRRRPAHIQRLRQLDGILPIDHCVLCKIAIHNHTLEFLVPSLAMHGVDHAAFALETAVDEVAEADGVADLKAFVGGRGADGFNMADAFVAHGDGVVGVHVHH